MNDLSGQSFGRYHLVEKLGEGGMAVVYKAFDTRLECDVAVKVIRLDNLPRSSEEVALKRFEREAKSVAQLTHPYIVKVSDFGEEDGLPYLVMEYLSGGTLKQFLGTPLPYRKAAKLLVPVAQALEYAHSHNLVHRDVKPSNILITESGQPMLTDFGIAKIMDMQDGQTLTGTGVGIGTPEYMAPEQWTGNITPSVDIFSLGVVFYELVTGHKPYTADTPAAVLIKLISDPLPKPSKFTPDLPEKVEQVIFKALAKKPVDRYQSMEELEKALKDLQTFESARKSVQPEESRASAEVDEVEAEMTQMESAPAETDEELSPAEPENETSATVIQPPSFEFSATGSNWAKDKENNMKIKLDTGVYMEFIRIPAGEFLMGSDPAVDPDAWEDEQPQHLVHLDEYWIGKTSVTRSQYKPFASQQKSFFYRFWYSTNNLDFREDEPFTNIDWQTAVDFCTWLGSICKRKISLPSEAQWEKAARGTDGRIFPWGNEATRKLIDRPSPFGVEGMAGDVWNWTTDWFSEEYYTKSPQKNPIGPQKGYFRVVRGGSSSLELSECRSTCRFGLDPTQKMMNVGFRCVLIVNK
jgi:serine/threonine protein kinase